MTPRPCRSFGCEPRLEPGSIPGDSNDCNTRTVSVVSELKNGAIRKCGLGFRKLAWFNRKPAINRLSFRSEMWLGV